MMVMIIVRLIIVLPGRVIMMKARKSGKREALFSAMAFALVV